DRAAEIVRRADVEIIAGERWSMGAREVVAHRAALVVAAADFAAVERSPDLRAALRAAFARAMRTPDTELAELFVVLRLPAIHLGWHRAYRDAPIAPLERPSEAAVLAGAAALLRAMAHDADADVLADADLETAPVASATELVRCVVRLDSEDLAAI